MNRHVAKEPRRDRPMSWLIFGAMLAGCSGSQPPVGSPGAIAQASAIAAHADYGKSWMLPEAKGGDLLYVSLSSGSVEVFDYKTRKQVGTLTGFELPQGQCVDKGGNVWITDLDAKVLVEYAHGATSPLKTLNTTGNPIGCSVSASGGIAVALGLGGVEIFKPGSTTGTVYKNHLCGYAWTPGYDLKGNLYFEGKESLRYSYKINVCELPAGGTSIQRVSFNQKIGDLGSVMWDGKYLALTDITNGAKTYVYQATETPSGDLSEVGTTQLKDAGCPDTEARQVFIVGSNNTPINKKQGDAILGGNIYCYNDFDGWSYPSGGKDTWSLSLRMSVGESVSLNKHG